MTDVNQMLRIPADLAAKIDKAAAEQNRTRHNMILTALREWVTKRQRKEISK